MDALVEAARERAISRVEDVLKYESLPVVKRKVLIARAINAVDALKFALKTIQ